MNVVKLGLTGILVVGLVGCSAPKKLDYSGLTAGVNGVEGDAFGQCVAESHRAAMQIDMAKAHLASLQAVSNSSDDLAKGNKAVAAAVAHRDNAMKGCDESLVLPVRKRVAALEAEARNTDARLTKLETVREIVRGVTFPTGSSALTRQAKTVLDVVANRLERAPRMVEVGGHASSTGNAQANMKLSQARAESVRRYFIKSGVDAKMITARGYGITSPVATNATEQGRRSNQRIELTYK